MNERVLLKQFRKGHVKEYYKKKELIEDVIGTIPLGLIEEDWSGIKMICDLNKKCKEKREMKIMSRNRNE